MENGHENGYYEKIRAERAAREKQAEEQLAEFLAELPAADKKYWNLFRQYQSAAKNTERAALQDDLREASGKFNRLSRMNSLWQNGRIKATNVLGTIKSQEQW